MQIGVDVKANIKSVNATLMGQHFYCFVGKKANICRERWRNYSLSASLDTVILNYCLLRKNTNMKNLSNRIKVFSIILLQFLVISTYAQQKDLAWYTANAPFKMPVVTVPVFADKTFSIKDFGGVGDGQTLNTEAFAKTIAACVAAGGGKVIVPAGLWLTGPIQLKSNINLEVQRGAIITFTSDHTQFPIIKASSTSTTYQPASPIYGYDLKNIAITGEGIIDGGGDSWRPVKKTKTNDAQWKKLVASGGVVSADGSVWWPTKEAMDGEASA